MILSPIAATRGGGGNILFHFTAGDGHDDPPSHNGSQIMAEPLLLPSVPGPQMQEPGMQVATGAPRPPGPPGERGSNIYMFDAQVHDPAGAGPAAPGNDLIMQWLNVGSQQAIGQPAPSAIHVGAPPRPPQAHMTSLFGVPSRPLDGHGVPYRPPSNDPHGRSGVLSGSPRQPSFTPREWLLLLAHPKVAAHLLCPPPP